MANTLLSDVIIPTVYGDVQANNTLEKSAFFQSGVAVQNAAYDALANSGSLIGHMPYWNDLSNTEPNYSTDNPSDVAVPEAVTQGECLYRMAYENKGWSSADLVADLTNHDPMQRVKDRVEAYFIRQNERRAIACLQGVYADNVANDSGDMIINIAGATNDDITANTRINKAAVINAALTANEYFDIFSAICVHPVVYGQMLKNNEIEFIKPADQNLQLAFYAGLRVIIDKNMPYTAAAGVNPTDAAATYVSYIMGNGILAYGEKAVKVPMEIYRRPDQGNGGGIETMWVRKDILLHPQGFSFTSNTVTGTSPTNAQLRLAANWDRKYNRESIPLAFLVTNG